MAIFWEKANRYGAWSSMIITAIISFVTDAYDWTFPEQVALYLPIGFATMITVSIFTKPEDENKLNAFYSLLNTPVGDEDKLEKAGISVNDDDDELLPEVNAKVVTKLDNTAALERGEGLILVDLLNLKGTFSMSKYKVDLKGFAISWLIVTSYLILAYLLSFI